MLYTGRTWDANLGLYDYRNRQYDPALGRFTTPDPLGPNADWNNLGNPYSYTAANPGAFVDPYGEAGFFADIRTGIGIWMGRQPPEEFGAISAKKLNRYAPDRSEKGLHQRILNRLETNMRARQGDDRYLPGTGKQMVGVAQGTLDDLRAWAGLSTTVLGGPVAIIVNASNATIDWEQGRKISAALGAVGAGISMKGSLQYFVDDADELANWLNQGIRGPGKFKTVSRGMTDAAADFQTRVTRLPVTVEYSVNGVYFEGVIVDNAGTVIRYLDAKNKAYPGLIQRLAKVPTARVEGGLLREAISQRTAVGAGIDIVWVAETEETAEALRGILTAVPDAGIIVEVLR